MYAAELIYNLPTSIQHLVSFQLRFLFPHIFTFLHFHWKRILGTKIYALSTKSISEAPPRKTLTIRAQTKNKQKQKTTGVKSRSTLKLKSKIAAFHNTNAGNFQKHEKTQGKLKRKIKNGSRLLQMLCGNAYITSGLRKSEKV